MTGTQDIAFWKAAARSSPDGLIVVDKAGIMLFASDHVQDLLGWTPEDLVGKPVEILIPEALRAAHPDQREAYHAAPSPRLMGAGRELSALAKNGRLVEIEIALSPMPLPGGVFVLAALRAPSPQRRLEKAFQSIFKATATSLGADFINVLVSSLGQMSGADSAFLSVRAPGSPDRMRSLAYWNRGNLKEPLDYPLANTPCERVLKGADLVILERVRDEYPANHDLVDLGAHAYIGVPLRAASGDILGTLVLLHGSALPDGAALLPTLKLFAMRAASELDRLQMEEKLAHSVKVSFQSEKMAAVGKLAAGVAHELNNPLGVILGFAQSLARRLKEDDPIASPIKSIERESLRCKALVSNLLSFSRSTAVTFRDFELAEAIEPALHLVEAQARIRSVAIRRDGVDAGLRVHGDSNQIQQVLINLCGNAIDAMPGGGLLTLSAGKSADKDGFAELRVADIGTGIPPDIRARIFEPFFTTKSAGKGAGLGLALVHEIAERHGGSVDFDTVPGKGTVFRVTLPLAS